MLTDIKDSIDEEEIMAAAYLLAKNGLFEKLKHLLPKVKDAETILFIAADTARNGYKNLFA